MASNINCGVNQEEITSCINMKELYKSKNLIIASVNHMQKLGEIKYLEKDNDINQKDTEDLNTSNKSN